MPNKILNKCYCIVNDVVNDVVVVDGKHEMELFLKNSKHI